MLRNFAFINREAKTKLKPLGKVLFYLYLTLALISVIGLACGIIELILKTAHISTALDAPLWEVILLIPIAWSMTRLFLRESLRLIDLKGIQKLEKLNDETEEKEKTNIIQFPKKSGW